MRDERTAARAKNKEGVRLMRAGDNGAAVDAFTEAIALDINYADAYLNRAKAYYNAGWQDESEADRNIYIDIQRKEIKEAQRVDYSRTRSRSRFGSGSDSRSGDSGARAAGPSVSTIGAIGAGVVLGGIVGVFFDVFWSGLVVGGIVGSIIDKVNRKWKAVQ